MEFVKACQIMKRIPAIASIFAKVTKNSQVSKLKKPIVHPFQAKLTVLGTM